jgi:hypothetical protein
MSKFKIATLALAVLTSLGLLPATQAAAGAPAAQATLTGIRAASHRGYDRLVFQFSGALPAQRSARYVPVVYADPSGKVVPVSGSARLLVRFFSAGVAAHLNQRSFALPGLLEAVKAGDFESVVTYGVGVARKEPVHLFVLNSPPRVVIDVPTPYRTTNVGVYLIGSNGSATAVSRPVIPDTVARGALQRLFAGPTPSEIAAGIAFVSSDATGFNKLSISDQIASVYLTGGCDSHGSAVTIATEIMPTLKQFRSVSWVKIYDPEGNTAQPTGDSDSLPACLSGS